MNVPYTQRERENVAGTHWMREAQNRSLWRHLGEAYVQTSFSCNDVDVWYTYQEVSRREVSLEVVRVDVRRQRTPLQRGQRQHGGHAREARQLVRARRPVTRLVPVLQECVLINSAGEADQNFLYI